MNKNTFFKKWPRDLRFLAGFWLLCFTLFTGQQVQAQGPCDIEIELYFPEYGDLAEWALIDGDGNVVLTDGYYDYDEYEDFTITETYTATNPPYSLYFLIDDSWACDNEVFYSISVGGIQDVLGTVFACEDIVEETIPLTAAFTACIPDCPLPTGLRVSNSTSTEITLEWTSTGTVFDVEWGLQGFVQGTAAGTLLSGIAATSQIFTNLEANEVYQFYVRRDCSLTEDGVSSWAGPFTFAMPVVMPSPWHEEFEEEDVLPLGWSVNEIDNWMVGEFYPEEENSLITNLYYDFFWGVSQESFTTVNVGPILNGDTFSFIYLYEDYWEETPIDEGVGNIVIEISTDYGQTYTEVETVVSNGLDGWQTFTRDMSDYAGQIIKIKITANIVDLFSFPDYLLSFDQFDISGGVFSCFEVTDVEVSDITYESAILTMESEGTTFSIEYGEQGFTPGEGTVISDIESPYDLAGLLDGTDYEVYVRADVCAPVFGPVAFTTIDLGVPQTITATDVVKTYGDVAFVEGSSDSGLALSYVVADPTVLTVVNGELVIVGAGETEVVASQRGNHDFLVADPVSFTVTVNKAPLTITANDEVKEYDGVPFTDITTAFTGFVYAETVADLEGAVVYGGTGYEAVTAGTYTLVLSGWTSDNYLITYQPGSLVISKATIQGITFEGDMFRYDGTAKSIFITGDLPAGTDVAYINNGQIAEGTYTVTAVINGGANYENIELSALLHITDIGLNSQTFVYDGAAKTLVVTGTVPADVTVVYSNNTHTNAGVYEVTATLTGGAFDDGVTLTATMTINKAVVAGIDFADATFVYDGQERELAITGTLPNGVTVGYTNHIHTDAGAYQASAFIDGGANYESETLDAVLTIEKASLAGVLSLDDVSYAYDGGMKTLLVTGTIPNGVQVTYENNMQSTAGVYDVVALVDGGANYESVRYTATLTITKGILTNVLQLNDVTHGFDGAVKTLLVTGTIPMGVRIAYTNNQQTNVGVYTVTATITGGDNYEDLNLTAVMTITIGYIPNVSFESATFNYDGLSKTLLLQGTLPAGTSVVYSNNSHTASGVYEATASIDGGANYHDVVLRATLTIQQGDVPNIRFPHGSFTYDGTEKSIFIEGNLPAGVEVTYVNNGQTEAGVYSVTAFINGGGHYNNMELHANLTIRKAPIAGLVFNGGVFVYDGTVKTLAIGGTLPAGATVDYQNNGKTNAGSYTVYADINAGANYVSVTLSAVLIIQKAPQEIRFDALAPVVLGVDADFQLTAAASTGLPIHYTYTYSGAAAAATVSTTGWVSIQEVGKIQITASQTGDANHLEATAVQELEVISKDASIEELWVEDVEYSTDLNAINYVMDCFSLKTEVKIRIVSNGDAVVSPAKEFVIHTYTPGVYRQVVTVTSQDGSVRTDYTIRVEKPFTFEEIGIQKFDNTLLINNNPRTNGGYTFVGYKWFRNGELVGEEQVYSAGATDYLDKTAMYHAVVTTSEGETIKVCPVEMTQQRAMHVQLYPNPVAAGGVTTLSIDSEGLDLRGIPVQIYNLRGQLVYRVSVTGSATDISLPQAMQSGVYMAVFELDGQQRTIKFIVE